MKTRNIGTSTLQASRLTYGCWRIAGTGEPGEGKAAGRERGRQAVRAALEAGFTLFDHADIYCDGEAERLFGEVLKELPGTRARILIASKCGIRKPGDPSPGCPHRYDFSAGHIERSCEQSLQRLGIETLDIFQLHRPDYLMDPDEVAGAFSRLKSAGKVREFGVSNFRPSQLTALQRACPMPLIVQQVEISLLHLEPLEDGTLDQCLAHRMTPMAWSPLGGGGLGNGPRKLLPSQEAYRPAPVNAALDAVASRRGSHRVAVALAWLLRHPAGITPIVGTTDPGRIREAADADTLDLSRDEWYELLRAAQGRPLP